MSPEMKLKLKNLLYKHEGFRQYLYIDSTGHPTIGIGRCLSTRGITLGEAYYLLDDDILYFTSKLSHFLPVFNDLSEARKIALIDMCFNLGIQGLLGFHDMIAALNAHDYVRAHDAMMHSKWAEQVGERATCLAQIILTGDLP